MINKIIIFGAGRLGTVAYHYYKNVRDVKCFIDNREDIWGTTLEGIPIFPPNVLEKYDLKKVRVVIAVKNKWKEIQKQLFMDYQIDNSILFQITEEYLDYMNQKNSLDCTKDEIIICYNGGIGNQMFQYALAKCFMKLDNNVTGDNSAYHLWHEGKFELPCVFPNVSIKKNNQTLKSYYEKVIDCQYQEDAAGKIDYLEADMQILERKQGVFVGYWQSYKYAEISRKELLHDFEFKSIKDNAFNKLKKFIAVHNTASIHVRRGDYLKCSELYGGICTSAYYDKAINYISQQVENIIFCFFSDDIDWVRQKYKELKNAVFVKADMFGEYENWYDMYLMSRCKHNIIANSTFSWWGAWLNRNPNKVVIAPKKWINGTEIKDICPPNWIRI